MSIPSFTGFIYIQQSGNTLQYSSDQSIWNNITNFPMTINNSNTGATATVSFTTDLTLSSSISGTTSLGTDLYFITNSDNITYNGNFYNVYINGISNYLGLIQNGIEVVNGKNKVVVSNIGITGSGSTLNSTAGWVCQRFYGRGTGGATSTTISQINNCYSIPEISGTFSGGICGNGSTCIVNKCYSIGNITGASAGGICGSSFGYQGEGIVNYCYSRGSIGESGVTSSSCGGICGNNVSDGGTSDTSSVVINNCYSTGSIVNSSSGGIYSNSLASDVLKLKINNCYTTGTGTTSNGIGFSGRSTITDCFAECSNAGNFGWKDEKANDTIGIGGTSPYYDISTGSTSTSIPYILNTFTRNFYNTTSTLIADTDSTNLNVTSYGSGNFFLEFGANNITIGETSGQLSSTHLGSYPFDVFQGIGDANLPYGYSIFNFTLNVGTTSNGILIQQGTTSINYYVSIVKEIIFPFTIIKINPSSSNTLNVIVDNDLTINGSDYFVIGSEYITFEGRNKNIVINIANGSQYGGIISNGTITSTGFSNTIINNINIKCNNVDTYGSVCRSYFGKGNNVKTKITNCSYSGFINNQLGGICPQNCGESGSVEISNCYSICTINSNESGNSGIGGICGINFAQNGVGYIKNCFSSITSYSTSSALTYSGIVYSVGTSGTCYIQNCYCYTDLTNNSSGILYLNNGRCYIDNCYSLGNMDTSNSSAGIFYSGGSSSNTYISYCYSSGIIGASSGGISYGSGVGANIYITNCYTSGSGTFGNGIVKQTPTPTATITITNSYAECNSVNPLGWNDENASILYNLNNYVSFSTNTPFLLTSYNTNFYNNVSSALVSGKGVSTNLTYTGATGQSFTVSNNNIGLGTSGNMFIKLVATDNFYSYYSLAYLETNSKKYNYNMVYFTLQIPTNTICKFISNTNSKLLINKNNGGNIIKIYKKS
jgi:hypothetical protein